MSVSRPERAAGLPGALPRLRVGLNAHVAALLLYLLLALAMSWPMPLLFTSHILGAGADPLHNLWLIWHIREALLLQEPLFYSTLLYYPRGITLLTHGLGPVMGLLALPFWPLGSIAAHNGAALLGLALSGYCMFLLARGAGFGRGVALFAGAALISAPMVAGGLIGHMTKVFVGGSALALLGLLRVADPQRRLWPWALATGLGLLVVMLHSGYQFVFCAFGLALLGLLLLAAAPAGQRLRLLGRLALAGALTLLILSPMILAVLQASGDSIGIDQRREADLYRPDATLLFRPSGVSRFWNWLAVSWSVENAVSLSWIGLGLIAIGLASRARGALVWSAFSLVMVLMALGPALGWGGTVLIRPMPYAWLLELPGMSFLRVPGRFMMVGFVGLTMAACYGLQALLRRWPRQAGLITLAATGLLLFERWPVTFRLQEPPAVPALYQQIAADPEPYAVYDLPTVIPGAGHLKYSFLAAPYQYLQTIHGKGIAAGYLSRSYDRHPLFADLIDYNVVAGPADLRVDGVPLSDPQTPRALLAALGYRYVTWHKTIHAEAGPAAEQFLGELFGDQPPLVDDQVARIYALDQEPGVMLALGDGWWPAETGYRWAQSSSSVQLYSNRPRRVWLELTPAALYDPAAPGQIGAQGVLRFQLGDAAPVELPATVEVPLSIPLDLPAGEVTLRISLEAGNFTPGGGDPRRLSFAIRTINVQTADPGP